MQRLQISKKIRGVSIPLTPRPQLIIWYRDKKCKFLGCQKIDLKTVLYCQKCLYGVYNGQKLKIFRGLRPRTPAAARSVRWRAPHSRTRQCSALPRFARRTLTPPIKNPGYGPARARRPKKRCAYAVEEGTHTTELKILDKPKANNFKMPCRRPHLPCRIEVFGAL